MAAPAHIARENGKKGGRPKGSTNKPHILDYMTEEDVETYFRFMIESYMGDMRLATWIGEQISGKAPQSMVLEGNPEKPLPIMNVTHNESNTQTK